MSTNEDISAELAGTIAKGEVFGSSENIRCGIYLFIIEKIRAEKVKVEEGEHRYVFWEVTPYESKPNPQTEGDRVDYKGPNDRGVGPLKDDGNNPNPPGSKCALKVNFDGKGARSAPGNAKAPILALFNKQEGEMSEADVAATFRDLARQKPIRKGEPIGFDPNTKQVIYATEDKQAQPARGMIIACRATAHKKRTANENGAYVTKMIWTCAAPMGTGINSPEEVAKRRAQIDMAIAAGDDDEEESTSGNGASNGAPQMPVGAATMPPGAPQMPAGMPPAGMQVPATPPQAAPAAPAPPTPPTPPQAPVAPVAPWAPPAGWTAYTDPQWFGATPESRWYHNNGVVKNEAQLRAGL